MLPVISINSKMIFSGNYTPLKYFILKDAEISNTTQESLKCLVDKFEDTMSSSFINIWHKH